MKTVLRTTFSAIILLWISIQGAAAQSIAIHQNDVWKAMLKQWFILKSTSSQLHQEKLELVSPALRIDLSMQDLIDQTTRIIEKHFADTDYHSQLLATITNPDGSVDSIAHFDLWYSKLNELAEKDSRLQKILNRKLVLQEYNLDGVALTDGIGMQRLKRIHLIEKYNHIATNPEGMGVLSRLSKRNPLTVTSASQLSKNEIEMAINDQYEFYNNEMIRLEKMDHQKYGGDTRYTPKIHIPRKAGKAIQVRMDRDNNIGKDQDSRRKADERFFKQIFNAIEKTPGKRRFVQSIDQEMGNTLPRSIDGTPMLTPSFIQEFEPMLTVIIKDLTWRKQLSQLDDETLFEFRKWIKHHRSEVQEVLIQYNQANQSELKLDWLNERKMPRRADVIESYEILRTIYRGTEPWQDEISTVMRNRRGNEVVIGRTIVGMIIRKAQLAIKDLTKSENIVGVAAGTSAFFLSLGNLPIALTTNHVVHDIYSNRKYDHNPRELLTQIPMDLLSGLLTQSSIQPGRIFNVIAYGAGSGALQGILTKQDPLKSAIVGATYDTALQLVPAKIRYPMVNGMSKDALAINAGIEIFSQSAKTTIRGGIVAAWEKRDVVNGMTKGAIYGASTAVLKIAVLGVRYNPLQSNSDAGINISINDQNVYANENSTLKNYNITKNTIQDTPYRTGGWLPSQIGASITLPGNVSIHPEQLGDIDVVTHEAHHLSQQEQLGLLRFYYQYILESTKVPYEEISFEISGQ